MRPAYQAEAERIGDNTDGCRDGGYFLVRLRTEYLDPDELMRAVLLAHQWSPDRLSGFCRRIQKELEQGVRHEPR